MKRRLNFDFLPWALCAWICEASLLVAWSIHSPMRWVFAAGFLLCAGQVVYELTEP
jgi:hypothetical protein